METSIQSHTNKSYSLIWSILCYRHKYGIRKLKLIMSTFKEWGLRDPVIGFQHFMKMILTKIKILGEILHETEVMIHGVSIVDLDWAEVIGIT